MPRSSKKPFWDCERYSRNVYKTGSPEVAVEGEGFLNLFSFHDRETDSIGIAEILVGIFYQ
jgi:hypothetical protein